MTANDPLKSREKVDKSIPSFVAAARKYHETLIPSFKSASHAKQWLGSLERHAEPKIGTIKVTDLTLDDFLAVLEPIWTTKRDTAEKLKQRMNAVMIWVIIKQYRPDNPMVGIEIALPKDREVKSACLTGDFVQGTKGTMQPVSGPKIAFELIQIDINKSFTNRAKLPLATLDFFHTYHQPLNKEETAKIVHGLEIRGLLAPLFGLLLGRSVKKNLRTAMIKLTQLAEKADSENHVTLFGKVRGCSR